MIVKRIKVRDNLVSIDTDKSKFELPLETYLNSKILLNEEIEESYIDKLKEEAKVDLMKVNLMRVLSKKKLSKKELKEMLLNEGISEKDSNSITAYFANIGLINDEEYASYIITYCLVNKKGKEAMKERLVNHKISGDYMEYFDKYIDLDKYISNIKYLISKYNKMAKNKSNRILKDYIILKLEANGYSKEEVYPYLEIESNDELAIAKKEIEKYLKTHPRSKENITKIARRLLNKGFNYDIIKKALGSDHNEVD